MFCKNCGAELEKGQRFCSSCGAAVESSRPKDEFVAAPVVDEFPDPAAKTPETAAPADAAPLTEAKPIPKKKGKGGLIALIAVAAVLLVGGLLAAFNWNAVSNWTRNTIAKTFASPEEYYRALELENLHAGLDLAQEADSRQASALAVIPDGPAFVEEKLQLRFNSDALGRDLLDLLQDELSMDLSWLHNVGLYRTVGVDKDGLANFNVAAFLNDKDLVSAQLAYDGDSTIYGQFPPLSDRYFRFELSDLAEELRGGYSEYLSLLTQADMPDAETFSILAERYAELVVNRLDDVEKGSATLKAGGVSKKYTTLTVRADGKTLQGILLDALDKLQYDAEVQGLLYHFMEAMGLPESERQSSYQEFLAALEETKADLREDSYSVRELLSTDVIMKLYVDSQGRIVGRDIEIREDEETVARVRCGVVSAGGKVGIVLSVGNEGNSDLVLLEGSGKLSGGKTTGKLTLTVNNGQQKIKVLTADFSFARQNGTDKFSLSIAPTDEFMDLALQNASYSTPSEVLNLVRSLKLKIEAEVGEKKSSGTLALLNGKDELLAFCLEEYEVKSFDVSLPKDAVDLQQWASSIDASKFSALGQELVTRLIDAGMPASFVQNLFGRYL